MELNIDGGDSALPLYDYGDFFNRRRRLIGDKKLQSKTSTVSFRSGDDDDSSLVLSAAEEKGQPRRIHASWVELEDINDPKGRPGIEEVRPNHQMQNQTIDMVNMVLHQAVDPSDQPPACIPEPTALDPDEEHTNEALRNLRIRQEILSRMLRHQRSIQQLRTELNSMPPPTGLGTSGFLDVAPNTLNRSKSFGSRPALYTELSWHPPRPESSQSSYGSPPTQAAPRSSVPLAVDQASPTPPQPSRWTTGSVPRSYGNQAPRIRLPYPDEPVTSTQIRHQQQWAEPTAFNRISPVQMPSPTSITSSQQSFLPQFQRPRSFSPEAMPLSPPQYSPLTHISSTPAASQAHSTVLIEIPPYDSQPTYTEQRVQTPFQLQVIPMNESQQTLQPAYSHLTKAYSVPNSQPEQFLDPRRRLPFLPRSRSPSSPNRPHSRPIEATTSSASAQPTGTSPEHNPTFSYVSATSVHSYEPFDPTASNPRSSVPWDTMPSPAPISNFPLASGKIYEPSAFEYAAVASDDGARHNLPRTRSADGGVG